MANYLRQLIYPHIKFERDQLNIFRVKNVQFMCVYGEHDGGYMHGPGGEEASFSLDYVA